MHGTRRYTEMYLHLVWGTAGRRAMLVPGVRERVYASIHADCDRLRCLPIAIGGTADHVHVLVRLGTSAAVGTLVKQLKGASSHLINHAEPRAGSLRWQAGYGAFTISSRYVRVVSDYILRQEDHHRAGQLLPPLERTD
jgi:putative transposase